MKTIIIAVAALIATMSAKAQAVWTDSTGGKYMLIDPVVWQFNQPACSRLYITSLAGSPSGFTITGQLAYMTDPAANPSFVGPVAVYSMSQVQTDSLRGRVGGYLFTTLMNAKGLTPAE